MIASLTVFGGLFALAFLAATIFPAQSEVGLAALIAAGDHSVVLLVAVASLGNTLGACVNWAIGRLVHRFRDRRWFPLKGPQMERTIGWYHRYGRWSLLMSWAPFIGDPLTVIAGVLREPFWSFLILVAIAKTARYVVVAAIALQLV